ncbi:MAG: HupE/UreJ family protein, partial [Akkermansiaceae bacterium]|nr:HupE/UreJ family protein [Akkermansiaceae bacterium]
LTPSRPEAHEIPADVTVQAFVKAAEQRLQMIVRVPLEAMRDFAWPVQGPGYLDLEGTEPMLRDAARMWIADYVLVYEADSVLPDEEIVAVRVSLPSDPSFATFETALARVTGEPLPASTLLPWRQAALDVLLEVPIKSADSRFSVDAGWAHLGIRTLTVLRFVTPSGAERAFQYMGRPGLVRLDPRWHHAALRFTRLGYHHILDGIDHLLFILCLVIPFRRL